MELSQRGYNYLDATQLKLEACLTPQPINFLPMKG